MTIFVSIGPMTPVYPIISRCHRQAAGAKERFFCLLICGDDKILKGSVEGLDTYVAIWLGKRSSFACVE